MRILITGGSGSLGRAICDLSKDTITVLTNDEYQWYEMRCDYPKVNTVFCDIKDYPQLEGVFWDGYDCVVHAAALKHVPMGESFPIEVVNTNIQGTENVARLTRLSNIPKAIFISSDKANQAVNVYGATKLIGEKIFLDYGYSVIRFVNFWGSRGSVIPLWQEQAKTLGYITVTDLEMVRYFITLEDAAKFTMKCVDEYEPNKIWTPPFVQTWTLKGLANEVCPNIPIKIIGNRGNEKMVENL